MKKKYRVLASRHDIQEHVVGYTEAMSDEEAIKWFDKNFRYNQNYGYDWLRMERIDQEEKTTQIARKD